MKLISEISVFFPAYNEEENIAKTVASAVKILEKIAGIYEVIVVDDGSKDRTSHIVKDLHSKNKRIRLVTQTPNQGYGAAIRRGFAESRYAVICYTDSDGQFDFEEIYNFIELLKVGNDMVVGYRIKRTDNQYRRLMARVLHYVGIFLFGVNVKDVDCGFKVFKKDILKKIGPLKTASAITETEFVTRTIRAGFKISEAGVQHHSREGGEQTGGKPSVILKAAKEGIILWWTMLREK